MGENRGGAVHTQDRAGMVQQAFAISFPPAFLGSRRVELGPGGKQDQQKRPVPHPILPPGPEHSTWGCSDLCRYIAGADPNSLIEQAGVLYGAKEQMFPYPKETARLL